MTLQRVDGQPFNLHSFDIGGSFVNNPQRWALAALLISSAGNYTAAVPGSTPTYQFHTPNLQNVTSVLFRPIARRGAGPNDFEFTLDNISVSAVPEPSAVVLVAGAAMALCALRRPNR
jgi:hypothetical protein